MKSFVGKAVGMSVDVPPNIGKMWKKRIDDAMTFYEVEQAKWARSFDDYRRCHDDNVDIESGREYRFLLENSVDENLIRSTADMVMKQTYMQNPSLEFTAEEVDDEQSKHDDFAVVCEKAFNVLAAKSVAPGFNLKPHVQKWILHGHLTNYGVVRLDFQDYEGSTDEAVGQISQIEEMLSKATSRSDIENLYSQLEIAHESISQRYPRGISLTNVRPDFFIVDPECNMIDLSDARWCAELFLLDRDYVRAKYMKKNKSGEWIYRSDGKTRAKADTSDNDSDAAIRIVENIVNSIAGEERAEVITKDKVKVYHIYDKLLRRIYVYSDDDWSHPLWVSEDDIRLSRFFRHFVLTFDTAIDGIVQPGVPSFYSGQVEEINRINREAKRVRDSIFGTLFYNTTNMKEEEADKVRRHFRNPNEFEMIGLKMDAEVDINKVMSAVPLPSFEFQQVFETRMLREGVDRYTHTTAVQRGGEFRTNTTNKAVEQYQNIAEAHSSYLQEAVEDAMELLGWSICEIIVSKFTKEDMIKLLGTKWGGKFEPMSVDEFNVRYRIRVAGGSMQKPTSQFKKKEAMDIAQAIGQVGQGTPMTAMRLILRLFKEAFSDFVVRDKDFEELEQEGLANITKGQSVSQPNVPARSGPNGKAPARPTGQ